MTGHAVDPVVCLLDGVLDGATNMAISQEVAFSDAPSLVEAGQTFDANLEDDGSWSVEYAAKALAVRWCAADIKQGDVAHSLLFGPSYFNGNCEPVWELFDSMRELFQDNARAERAVLKAYTPVQMAKKKIIKRLDNYARQSWGRLLKAKNNSVLALCLEQSPPLEFIEPKKPANPESEARKARKEASLSDADRAAAEAKVAIKKAAKAKSDEIRNTRDSLRTDVTEYANLGLKAVTDGDIEMATKIVGGLTKIGTKIATVRKALKPDPQS